ncbi:MAG: response regulator [Cyanobacteria bacterium J06600_6]
MWVDSEPGVGSTFYFTISANVAPEASEAKTLENRLVGKQILIVDDNATNRQILTLQAQAWGANSHTVESGAKALELMSTGIKLDLAILDMQMPGMDGLTLARAIRQQEKDRDLPLIMLSSLGKQAIVQQAQDINFAAIVSKPIPQSRLYQVLVKAIAGMPIKIKSTDTSMINANLADEFSLNILLAEDIVVNQKVALLILKQMGYRADVANNGMEVIAALRRQNYDVVLMDMQMPEMDGLTATKLINEEFDAKIRPRIIAMTANAMTGDREKCLAAGMDDYVSKPIRVEELRVALIKCKPFESDLKLESKEMGGQEAEKINNSALDLSVLESICEMAGAEASLLVEEMVTSYLDDTQIRLQAIANAIKTANVESIFQAAHSMKSSSANLGAVNLAQLCEELERLGKDKTIEGTEPLLSNAESEFQQVEQELRSFLTSIS